MGYGVIFFSGFNFFYSTPNFFLSDSGMVGGGGRGSRRATLTPS